MKKLFLAAAVIFAAQIIHAAPLSLSDCYGRWQNSTYVFTFNKNYTSSIIIFVSPTESYVFNGVFNIDHDNLVRINISEMKSCPPSCAFTRSGFSKTASSHFTFIVEPKRRSMTVRPKEIVIDGNSSEGYFDQEISLKKN